MVIIHWTNTAISIREDEPLSAKFYVIKIGNQGGTGKALIHYKLKPHVYNLCKITSILLPDADKDTYNVTAPNSSLIINSPPLDVILDVNIICTYPFEKGDVEVPCGDTKIRTCTVY